MKQKFTPEEDFKRDISLLTYKGLKYVFRILRGCVQSFRTESITK